MCISFASITNWASTNKKWLFNGIVPALIVAAATISVVFYETNDGAKTVENPENKLLSQPTNYSPPNLPKTASPAKSSQPVRQSNRSLPNTIISKDSPGPIRSKLIVLVPPFENSSEVRSRKNQVDRYSEASRTILENILIKMGVLVVERQRVDAILLESEFRRNSGLTDIAQAQNVAKLLGANSIIMGTIINISRRTNTFSGYGIRTKTIEVEATIRIRLIDITRGTVKYSKEFDGREILQSTNYGATSTDNAILKAISIAIKKLKNDSEFKNIIKTATDVAQSDRTRR